MIEIERNIQRDKEIQRKKNTEIEKREIEIKGDRENQ